MSATEPPSAVAKLAVPACRVRMSKKAASPALSIVYRDSTLPSAASTLVFAAPYKPSEDMASLMNASLLLHKVVGFPVLFLAAAIATTRMLRSASITLGTR